MKIEYLADHMQHVTLIAGWFHDEWGYMPPGRTLEERIDRLHTIASQGGIPTSFVALEDGRPVGSASLVECDMHSRSDLKPWLSTVYVATSSRRQGIGTALVARVIDEAQQHGFSSLYLWTPGKESFYGRRGWTTLGKTRYKNEDAVLMVH